MERDSRTSHGTGSFEASSTDSRPAMRRVTRKIKEFAQATVLPPGTSGEAAFLKSLDALGAMQRFDPAIRVLQRAVRALPLGSYRDVLHGRQLGHPLHPALVQLPMGAWLSAALLDAVPGTRRSAPLLVGAGLVAAVPAALSGYVDWAEQHEQQMRTGLVHAASNAAAVGLYAGSWVARGRHRYGWGRALAYAGLCMASAGAMLGGHLAFRQAAGANKAEPVPHLLEPEWRAVGAVEEFPVGEAVRRELGEVPVLVVRESGGDIHVLADRCSHFSGPLSEGRLLDGCVDPSSCTSIRRRGLPRAAGVENLAEGLHIGQLRHMALR